MELPIGRLTDHLGMYRNSGCPKCHRSFGGVSISPFGIFGCGEVRFPMGIDGQRLHQKSVPVPMARLNVRSLRRRGSRDPQQPCDNHPYRTGPTVRRSVERWSNAENPKGCVRPVASLDCCELSCPDSARLKTGVRCEVPLCDTSGSPDPGCGDPITLRK